VSALGARFRQAAAGVTRLAVGSGRPGVELVRVGPASSSPRPLRALPAPPHPTRRQGPVNPPPPELHPCPFCGKRHQLVPLGGRGLAAAYARQLGDPSGSRPTPIGRDIGDTSSLVRDGFHPWRAHPAAVPPPPGPSTLRERLAGWWQGDGQEPMT
jgi:hypothetical protein